MIAFRFGWFCFDFAFYGSLLIHYLALVEFCQPNTIHDSSNPRLGYPLCQVPETQDPTVAPTEEPTDLSHKHIKQIDYVARSAIQWEIEGVNANRDQFRWQNCLEITKLLKTVWNVQKPNEIASETKFETFWKVWGHLNWSRIAFTPFIMFRDFNLELVWGRNVLSICLHWNLLLLPIVPFWNFFQSIYLMSSD